MRETNLPSPGRLSNSHNLRRTSAIAISSVQMAAAHTPGGKVRSANQLQAFFTACAAALASYIEIDSTPPTVISSVRTGTNTVVLTFNEAMDQTKVAPNSAFVFTPARTVTSVAFTGSNQLTITATGAVAGDTLAYTQPGAAVRLRDLAGNLLASFSGQAVA